MHNTNVKKFKSIVYGYSNQITISSNENFDVSSIIALRKQQFNKTSISVTLIYRSPNSPLAVFIDCLRYLLGRNIDLFLGDFTDELEEVPNLKEVFCNYKLKVTEPTNSDGVLLDHIYVSKLFENDKYVTSVVKNIYFSCHDAVKVQIRFRQNNQENNDFHISDWIIPKNLAIDLFPVKITKFYKITKLQLS